MKNKALNRRDFLRMAALTAAGAALSGCGPAPTPEVVKETVEVPVKETVEVPVKETVIVEVTPEPPALEPVTIKYWRHFTDSGDRVTKQMVEDFKQVAPELTVEYEAVPDAEYEQRLTVAAAAGEEADVYQLNEALFPRFLGKGVLAPVDFAAMGLADKDAFLARFLPNVLNPTVKDGQHYMGGMSEVGTWAIAYNKACFDNAGVEYLSDETVLTWEQYYELAVNLTLREGGTMTQMGEGQWITAEDNPAGCFIIVDPIFKQHGGDAFDTETGMPTNKDVWLAVGQMMADCALGGKYGYMDTGFPTSFNAHPEMFNNRIAMLMGGIWVVGWGQSVNPDLQVGFAPFPAVDQSHNAAFTGFWGWVVSNQAPAEEQAAAWKWVAFLDNDGNCFTWFDEAGEVHPRSVLGLSDHMVAQQPGMKVFFADSPRGQLVAGSGKNNMTNHWDLIRSNFAEAIFKVGTAPEEAVDQTWAALESAAADWE
jgi:multiple sugar transport system substrate-binding protein